VTAVRTVFQRTLIVLLSLTLLAACTGLLFFKLVQRISPKDGHVIAWIDLTGLLPDNQKINAESVLNGIAYNQKNDKLFVTCKQWPTVFEIKIVPKSK